MMWEIAGSAARWLEFAAKWLIVGAMLWLGMMGMSNGLTLLHKTSQPVPETRCA